MSYRNDHDAAIARIDALEAELGKNVDAKERFTSLELQLATAKAERDRMRDALAKQAGRTGSGTVMALVGAAAIVIAGFGYAIHSATRHATLADETPVAHINTPAASAHALQIAQLMACVSQLDGVVARRSPSSASCLDSIHTQASDPTLGVDIHQVLSDWYSAESKFSTSDDAVAQRDQLVTRIHEYVIPSYTR
jgi:hypothetical protein